MKKTFILSLLICARFCFANYTGTINTNQSELIFSTESGFDVVSFSNQEHTDQIGAPQLPVKTVRILVPIDQIVTGITINSTTVQQISGSYNIYPVQTPEIIPNSVPFDNQDPSIYSSNVAYPNVTGTVIEDGYPFGYHVVTLKFYPLQYIPASQILNLYTSISFTLQYAYNSQAVLLPLRQSQYSFDLNKNYVTGMVENPGDISITGGGASQVVSNGALSPNMKGMSPTGIINLPEYIIIT